jgi:hypothetical protein
MQTVLRQGFKLKLLRVGGRLTEGISPFFSQLIKRCILVYSTCFETKGYLR